MSNTTIETLVAEYNKVKEEFVEKSKNALRTAFKEFFASNPDIDQITWAQYTPYFNDGDPCIFRVNDMFFTLDEEHVDLSEIRYPDDDEKCYGTFFWSAGGKNIDPVAVYRKTFEDFVNQVSVLPDEIFMNSFGDHVSVIASKDGFDVQEYEHD
jgi:hypothetical protein